MTRASLGIWIGVGLAVLLAGCSQSNLLFGEAAVGVAPNGEHYVYGKLDAVAANTKASLERVHLHVDVEKTDKAGVIRLASATLSGKRFVLVLTSEQTSKGERVLSHVEWQDPRDGQAEVSILAHVDKQAGK